MLNHGRKWARLWFGIFGARSTVSISLRAKLLSSTVALKGGGGLIKTLGGYIDFITLRNRFFHHFLYNSTTCQEYFPKVSSQS